MKLTKSRAGVLLIIAIVIITRDIFKTDKTIIDGIALSILAIVSLYFLIASIIVRKKEPEIYNAKYTFIALLCSAVSVLLLIFFVKSIG
ncbi:MAG: hypothetical protein J0M18_17265 [Ignavibacteria bacterium]|nr:hypothetical protein [Ignavibacteria bacterium]